VCLGVCSDVLIVQNLAIACSADLLGVSYSCQENLLRPGQVEATYVRLPSLASFVGVSRIDGTLVGLRRDGEVVYSSTVSDHVWHAAYGGWVFHAVYWPLVGLIAWRWPKSWLARRFRPKNR